MTITCRFPKSLPFVIIDGVEKLYLAGFPLLQLFVTVFPVLTGRRGEASSPSGASSDAQTDAVASDKVEPSAGALEFLPLMLTSVYCAIGLVWAFLRLSVIYIRQQY